MSRPTDDARSTRHLLLFDGACGFCATIVRWVLQRDPHGSLLFAPLAGETARPILARHPELAGLDSVVFVEDWGGVGERVFVKSEVAALVGRYLGGWYRLNAWTDPLLPRRVRDWIYDFVARHRHQLTRNGPECLVPKPEERARFLP